MNLLFLVHRIPYPPNKGDKIRSWNELRHLNRHHTVHVGCLMDQPEDARWVEPLRQQVASLEVAPIDPRRARLRSLQALWQGGPLSVPYFRSRRLQEWVDATLQHQRIDAILLFSSPMFSYVSQSNLPMVMDFCDVDSDKWAQYARKAPLPMRPLYALEGRRLAQYELQVLRRCQAATLVTEQEKEIWSPLPRPLLDKVHVIPNGVDLEYFSPSSVPVVPPRSAHAMSFTGAMDYYANVDAVTWFADEVLPRVQSVYSDATFTIVGSRPPAEVQELAKRPGIEVTGFVDDIREWYLRSSLCVVPLRIARGIQNKVLEAMSMGRPVLATSPAFEGLGAEAGADLEVADGAEAFAAQAIRLLGDPVRAETMGRAGRQFVETRYVWEGNMQRLEELLQVAMQKDLQAAGA
jgi:sugar transferase (PEP-CTERM/EpsH1 system associated)